MKAKWFVSIATAVLMTASLANADNTIVVTATRSKIKAIKSPSFVSIISKKQIKQQGIDFTKNVLKFVPGLSVSSNGPFGGLTNVFIRGLSSRYTKFLLDGVDVSDPSQTQPYLDFGDITSNSLSRIEIVEGGQSGLYGANAIAGVINMITKTGKGKPYIKYTQEAGSFNTYSENLESGGRIKNTSFYIDVFRMDTKGISKMDKFDNKTHSYSRGDEKDAFYKTALNSRIEFIPKEGIKLGNIIILSKDTSYLDVLSSPPNDSNASNLTAQAKGYRQKSKFIFDKLYLSNKLNRLANLDIDLFYVNHKRKSLSDPQGDYYYKGKRWGYSVKLNRRFGVVKIILGSDYAKEYYKDSGNFKKLRYNIAGFGEAIAQINNLTLQAAAREDHFKTFGNHFTYKVGANYLIPETNTILKANYATGFRAPSIWELYSSPNPSWQFLGGNSSLDPERSKGWSFGVMQYLYGDKITASATYFKNIIKDRITYYTDPATWQSTYKNVKGKTVSDGFETQITAKPADWLSLNVSYTYTKSINPDTGRQSARIPLRVYSGWIKCTTLNSKLSALLDGRYIGRRYDDKNHTHQTGKYAVFDFTTLYKPLNNLELSLTIKNIFNRFYQEVYGYSTLPRSVFAKVSYKF
ncbi:TonB-dependent receptor plug domain-containing protein [Hippea jasoniae]|uniref:TonB-dependent receptor plug domain-containing protein n=1 Tax=Hippea jasoniae TaxID=944479 RepID=UPI0005525AE2|nr:TonB-dependent receptor [Hippea jasoniae]